jgi:HPt (histidine-containing phosphotransfer) domain-containing protein
VSAADDVLDLSQILAAFGEIDDDVREMMQMFVETTAPMLVELEALVAARDGTAAEDHAHSIKGAARSAGARAMAAASEAVEAAARAGDWAEVELKLALIRPAFDAARKAIARL